MGDSVCYNPHSKALAAGWAICRVSPPLQEEGLGENTDLSAPSALRFGYLPALGRAPSIPWQREESRDHGCARVPNSASLQAE